ncbi:MAG TPA: sialate O-acetylesterase [Planctomycetota bacterium]|nr:sialate O-acetylesterase [Planctomycetota bacterium]
MNACVHAAVVLPPVISDGMVLQADLAVPIFGTAGAGESVTVEFNGQKKTATAGADGKWLVKLDPMKAGGPFELKVGGTVIKDVLVGEVWLASGQSNMRFPLSKATGGTEDIAKSANPKLRYFMGGKWVQFSPQTAPNFAAVAYYFATELHSHVKSPVGIIENAVNGAIIQTFMSPESINADPAVAAVVERHSKAADQPASSHWKNIEALIPFGIKGAIWCQGEGNRDFPQTYPKLFSAMLSDWRKRWGVGDFPFLYVQLGNFGPRTPEPTEGRDCVIRETQLQSLSIPNTALVVAIDLGIEKDVHYPNKKPVGVRLARAARALAYGEKIEYSGPLFKDAKIEGGKAVVSFTHVGGGLAAKDGAALKGFTLCGADKKFVRAEAKIEGQTVVVSSPNVPAPAAVRYGWERNPDCNLINKEELPASPFRSDKFENYFTRDSNE